MRSAFTLFEIAVALAVIALVVTSLALVFPVGIRAQRLARFQVYAGTKVLELMDHFSQHEHMFFDRRTEAERMGQTLFSDQVPVDLDTLMMTDAVCGLLPLPTALARRIDSDGDEIARLLDAGGRVFYPTPRANEGGSELLVQSYTGPGSELPSEAQTLLFGVVGCAQQNALPNHPCQAWPYQEFWPAPPQPWEADAWKLHDGASVEPWPAYTALADIVAPSSGAGVTGDTFAALTEADLIAYLRKAQALVLAAGVACDTTDPKGPVPKPPADLASLAIPWAPGGDPTDPLTPEDAFPRPWKVLAMRYLANAAVARTGSRCVATPADPADRAYARSVYDVACRWAMRYAATDPYDWGCPRPLNRQLAFDAPLLEFDLFPVSPLSQIATGDGTGDVSWRVIPASPVRDIGQGRGHDGYDGPWAASNHAAIVGSWGDPAHANLTVPFDAAERAREVVVWSVDWRAYEDFESAPSGPFDASSSFVDSRGKPVVAERSLAPPDLHLCWRDADRSAVVGYLPKNGATPRVPLIDGADYKAMHLGMFGADRNGNGRFDRGPLPPTARQRAVLVGRWTFYDRRLIGALRN